MMNKLTENHIVDNSIFKIWDVIEIIWQSVRVKVDTWKNTSSILYKWDIIQNISVWGYIKIKKWFEVMIWKIEWETIKESKENTEYSSNKEKIYRILNIKILWFFEWDKFKRWIKELPLIDNTCYLLTREEFEKIHDFLDNKDEPIKIWKLEYDDWQDILLWVNKLFASHVWIFWNTWSWKSYTLAKIYKELFEKYKDNLNFQERAKFCLIDFNWEYIWDAIIKKKINWKKYKNIFELTTNKQIEGIGEDDKFPINKKTLKNTTFWSIFLEATEKTQMPFLNRAIKDTFIEEKLNNITTFKQLIVEKIINATSVSGGAVDKTITEDFLYELANFMWESSIRNVAQYFRDKLVWWTERFSFQLDWIFANENPTWFKIKIEEKIWLFDINCISRLDSIRKIWLVIIIKYYDEMIRGFSNKEHLSPLIKRLEKRILDLEKVIRLKNDSDRFDSNFTIISLRNVNLDIRKMIPMLLVKELYDEKKKNTDKNKSLHIIIDEAHNILSRNSDRESEQWKDYRLEVFEEIIKEGRKFWTFLTIASQRPSDISSTIISQLHNYFLHRLINNNDLMAVEKTIAYLDKISADSIPNLATWTCILAWLIAQIPIVMKVWEIENKENRPNSETITLVDKWKS